MPLIFFLLAFNVRATAFETQVVPSDSLTLRELFDKDTFNEKNCNRRLVIHCLCEYVSKWMCILWSHRSDSSDFSSSSFPCQGNSYWGLSCLIHRFCWSFLIRQLHLGVRNNQSFEVIDNWHNKQVHKIFAMHTFCNDGLMFQAFQTIPPLEVNAKIAPIILWYSYHDVHFNVMFAQHETEKKMFVQQTHSHPILY